MEQHNITIPRPPPMGGEVNIGNQKLWNNTISGCLLWMDDVALIHHDKEEPQMTWPTGTTSSLERKKANR